MINALQQGHADGMCGLYAILNFLRSKRQYWDDCPQESLTYILETCDDFGWLKASYLVGGFDDCNLKRILDVQFEHWRMPFATHYISDVVENRTFLELVDAVIVKGGSLIAGEDAKTHWVLVTKRNGQTSIVDSDSKDPVRPLGRVASRFSLDWGLVIMPAKRPLVQIDI